MKLSLFLLSMIGIGGIGSSALSASASDSTITVAMTCDLVLATQTVTYTCTAATGEIQYRDANGDWQTLLRVTKGHVFVTDTDQEGNFRFLPEDGWTRKVG